MTTRTIELTVPDSIQLVCKHKESGTAIQGTFDTSTMTSNHVLLGMIAELRRGFAQGIVRKVSSTERQRLVSEGFEAKCESFLPTGHYVPEKSIDERIDDLSHDQKVALLQKLQALDLQVNEVPEAVTQ